MENIRIEGRPLSLGKLFTPPAVSFSGIWSTCFSSFSHMQTKTQLFSRVPKNWNLNRLDLTELWINLQFITDHRKSLYDETAHPFLSEEKYIVVVCLKFACFQFFRDRRAISNWSWEFCYWKVRHGRTTTAIEQQRAKQCCVNNETKRFVWFLNSC